MFTYWFPTPLSFWWPLGFAIGFAVLAVLAVSATWVRQEQERDANLIALLYGAGFGVVAVSEFLMYLYVVYGWSLAPILGITSAVLPYFVVAAMVVAILAVGLAVWMQIQEESGYQAARRTAH